MNFSNDSSFSWSDEILLLPLSLKGLLCIIVNYGNHGFILWIKSIKFMYKYNINASTVFNHNCDNFGRIFVFVQFYAFCMHSHPQFDKHPQRISIHIFCRILKHDKHIFCSWISDQIDYGIFTSFVIIISFFFLLSWLFGVSFGLGSCRDCHPCCSYINTEIAETPEETQRIYYINIDILYHVSLNKGWLEMILH